MRRICFTHAFALVSIVAVAVSCDAITGGGGSFTVTLSDTTLNLGQGKRDTVVITLGRSSYNKPIALTVDGVPAGVTATLLAPTVPGNSSVTGMEVVVSPTATPATTKLTIHATGAGVSERTASFDVAVGVTGSFSMSSDGFPLTAAQGGGGVGTILVTRSGGHADNVTLLATGLPSGVTASFAASPTTGSSTPVTFAAAAGAAPGNYNLTITGTAAGIALQSVPVTVSVIAPPATAALTMSFCNVPVWLAYRNQGYAWQAASPSGSSFTFQATSAVGVAYVVDFGSETDMFVNYATRDELAARGTDDCPGTKTLTGSISGATIGQSARVSMGAIDAVATQASPNFTLNNVPSRTLDLIATKGTIAIDPGGSFYTKVAPDRLVMQRSLNLASGSSVGTIDFAGQGFAPLATSLTVANTVAADSIHVANTFRSSTGTHGVTNIFETTATTNTLYSMPAAQFGAGDINELLVETYQPDFSGRYNYSYLGPVTDRTETLAPVLMAPTVSVISTTPYTRLRGMLPVQAEYPALVQFGYGQGGGNGPDRVVYVLVSAGYLGATPASAWDAPMPEFGSVSGLNNSWLLSSALVSYYVEADGGPALALFGGPYSIGDNLRWALRYGTNGTLLRAGLATKPWPGRVSVRSLGRTQYLRR